MSYIEWDMHGFASAELSGLHVNEWKYVGLAVFPTEKSSLALVHLHACMVGWLSLIISMHMQSTSLFYARVHYPVGAQPSTYTMQITI